jgi:hypothetical protein
MTKRLSHRRDDTEGLLEMLAANCCPLAVEVEHIARTSSRGHVLVVI